MPDEVFGLPCTATRPTTTNEKSYNEKGQLSLAFVCYTKSQDSSEASSVS